MSTSAKSSSEKPEIEKPRGLFSRLNARFPWLKLITVIFVGIIMLLDLLDLTISKTDNLADDFPTTPMSKHVKATERDLKNKKLVALTFDDGPSAATTPTLLDILSEKNALATFFMLGIQARANPDIVRRISREGHEIGSHTMYHQNLPILSPQAAADDIAEAKAVFRDILGYEPLLTRPPYGNFNDTVLWATGTPLVLWSVDTRDWEHKDPGTTANFAIFDAHDGAIVLMHDIHPSTIEAVPAIIDSLRQNGYEFVTISELAELRGASLSTGAAFYKFSP